MASTFETDGYRDAISGNGYHPPDAKRTSRGVTNVYAQEYHRGYTLACRDAADWHNMIEGGDPFLRAFE